MLSRLTDEEVIRMALLDANVYGELIKRYEKKIFYYIARILNQYKDAEDLTQETFIKAYENLAGFNFKFKFSSWLYRIAHNMSVNFIKKNYKHKVYSLDEHEFFAHTVATKENILQELIGREQEEILFKAMQRLPLKYRSFLELSFFEGKSYLEIADILKVSVNSVGPMILRGKKMLKKYVQEIENGK